LTQIKPDWKKLSANFSCDLLFVADNAFEGSIVTQSSTRVYGNGSLAIDGNMLTCASTEAELVPWWQIDLGNYYHLQGIVIYTNTKPDRQSSGLYLESDVWHIKT
jgi:hypothetical protein